MIKKDIVITPQKAAELCYVSSRTIRNWLKHDGLKHYTTPGGHYKIKLSDLKKFTKTKKLLMANYDDDTHTNIKKILIVDDDQDIVDLLKLNLSKIGFKIETASNGIEAGTRVVEFKPDLILLDIMMPEMDGLEALKQFKSMNYTKKTPIIILSSVDEEKVIKKAYKYGAASYLTKPVKIHEVIVEIQKIIFKGE
jgi:excisionase family DNA binding protein